MEEEEETDLARVDSWLQSTVPSIPKFFAVICLIFNIVVPGLGTFIGGFLSCCCGRPRYEFRPAQYRCPVALLVMFIGVAQLLATAFFLVGWLWSIIWGFLMVNLSGAEFRKMPPKPEPPAAPPVVSQPKASEKSTTIQIEDDASRGRKNFANLINKASENKMQAMMDGNIPENDPSSEPSKDENHEKSNTQSEESNHFSSNDNTTNIVPDAAKVFQESTDEKPFTTITFGPPVTATDHSQAATVSDFAEKPSGSHIEKSPASRRKVPSIFGCFKSNPKSFVAEKLGQFITGNMSSSMMDLLHEGNASEKAKFTSAVHRAFQHWRKRANRMATKRLKFGHHSLLSRIKLPNTKELSSLPVKKEISEMIVNSESSNHSSSNSLHRIGTPTATVHPVPQVVPVDIEHVSTLTPSVEEPVVDKEEQLPLNPSTLLEVVTNEKLSSIVKQKSRTLQNQRTAQHLRPKPTPNVSKKPPNKQHFKPVNVTEMKPRITQSHTYHYSVR